MGPVVFVKGKRTAIYCRVDCGKGPRARREALQAQRQRLERYARVKRFQISGYYEDDGFSGHDLDRPGITQMIKGHRAGAFEQVLVANYARLYRGSRWNDPHWPFEVYALDQSEHLAILKR